MKYCPSCATGLDDNIKECPQCGYIFEDVSSTSNTTGNLRPGSSATAYQQRPPQYTVTPDPAQMPVTNTTAPQATPKWKKLLPLFIAIGVIVTIMQGCIFGLSGSGTTQTESEITTTTTLKTYDVSLNIECDENLFFSKYDVVVLIDGQRAGKMDHGTKMSFTVSLTEGIHTIKFHKDGSESVDGSREIDVTGKTIINCKIHCTASQVEINEFDASVVNSETTSETTQSVTSSNQNNVLANFSLELPTYWEEETAKRSESSDKTTYYYQTDTSDKLVKLMLMSLDDPDNAGFKSFVANKAQYVESIVKGLKASKHSLIKQEVVTYGEASGLLVVLDATVESSSVVYDVRVYSFLFPSVEMQKTLAIQLLVSNNAQKDYLGDYSNMLRSLKKFDASSSTTTDTTTETTTETTKPTPTPIPKDVTKAGDTRFAFKRSGSDYTIYYIIDVTEKKVYYFTSQDSKPTVGTIEKGNLKTGLTVKYPYDGGTDVISYYKGQTTRIVVYDQNGFDWYFDACYVSEAEKIITQ